MQSIVDMFRLAVQRHQSGNLAQAEALYRQILQADPSHADSLHHLGILAHQAGHAREAVTLIRQALALNPNGADFHFNLGNALRAQGGLDEAAQCYREALRRHPASPNVHNNLGLCLLGQGRHAEAADSFHQALHFDANYAIAHNNLGMSFVGQNRFAEAANCFRHALALNPSYANAHNNLGFAHFGQGHLPEAVECYREALRINPNHLDAHINLGCALKEQGKYAAAADCYGRVLALDPGHKMAIWNRAVLRLSQGDFEEGWPDFEQRWARPGVAPRSFEQPRWDGTPLRDKTLLVYAEQGLGDTIQFARFLPLVKQCGGPIVLECQPALASLLTRFAGIDHVVAAGTRLPSFDVQIPLLSLPGIFRTALATIPKDSPYLSADSNLVQHWRALLFNPEPTDTANAHSGDTLSQEDAPSPAAGSRVNVGIAWQGSLGHAGDRRSVAVSDFAPLARVAGIRLVSLQVAPGSRQLSTAGFPTTDFGSRFDANSLEDLAAVIMSLDLVVTVDTVVAHMAGALGVPVWVTLPNVCCWRWLLERSDSPWYPTMRLFRQTRRDEWADVFERIAEEIATFVVERPRAES